MDIVKLLEQNGIRPSLLRTEVMRYLYGNQTHPSVDTIYDDLLPRIPTLSKTSVYNILNLFIERKIIQDITIDSKQSRYDYNITEHAHFLCSNCSNLYDVDIEPIKIKTEHKVNQSQLYIKGVCLTCSTLKNK